MAVFLSFRMVVLMPGFHELGCRMGTTFSILSGLMLYVWKSSCSGLGCFCTYRRAVRRTMSYRGCPLGVTARPRAALWRHLSTAKCIGSKPDNMFRTELAVVLMVPVIIMDARRCIIAS